MTTTKTSAKTAKPRAHEARERAKRKAREAPQAPSHPALAKPLSSEDIVEVLKLGKGSNSIELKLSVPAHGPSRDDQEHRARPGRGAAAAGVLLRYARPGLEPGRRGRAGPANPGRARRHGHQAAPGGSGHHRPGASPLGELQDRGGCDAGRVRVLGVVQGRLHRPGGARRDRRRRCRCASCSRRNSAPSTTRTRRRASRWTSWSSWAPPSCSRPSTSRRTSIAASPSKCGSIPMARASWRSPPSACRRKPSRSPPSSRPTSPGHGIALGADQATKTKTSLEFFSRRLASEAPAR